MRWFRGSGCGCIIRGGGNAVDGCSGAMLLVRWMLLDAVGCRSEGNVQLLNTCARGLRAKKYPCGWVV